MRTVLDLLDILILEVDIVTLILAVVKAIIFECFVAQ